MTRFYGKCSFQRLQRIFQFIGLMIARAQQKPGLRIARGFFNLFGKQWQGLLHLALFQQLHCKVQHSG